jgi:hypothetical protein
LGEPAAAERPPLVIIVSPKGKPGHFRAKLESTGELLVGLSRQPFVDSARVLAGKGHNGNATLVMKHAGSDTVALTAKLSTAARLSVEGDRFVPCREKATQTCVGAPPVAPNGPPAPESVLSQRRRPRVAPPPKKSRERSPRQQDPPAASD